MYFRVNAFLTKVLMTGALTSVSVATNIAFIPYIKICMIRGVCVVADALIAELIAFTRSKLEYDWLSVVLITLTNG